MTAMMGALLVSTGALLLAGACRVIDRRRKRSAVSREKRRAARQDARREAYYMRNFWSYDGSGQEEFEE